MEKIAIVGSGYMAKIIATRAKEIGIETHCFSWDNQSVAAEVVDFFHEISIFDIDEMEKVCKQHSVEGVIATTELTILPVAKLALRLGLNGNSIETAKSITNKYLNRKKVMHIKDIKQPGYWIYKGENIPVIDKYPVIVKPMDAGGKRGISVVYNKTELVEALKVAKHNSRVSEVIVEEYLEEGREYSVESLSFHGKHYIIQITEKDSSGPPHCVELGHHQPPNLEDTIINKVKIGVANILTSIGVENGPCHTEIKICNEQIYLIEVNGRAGGDHIAYPLTELSTGYPYITGIIMAALNRLDEREITNLEHNYCGVHFVTTQNSHLKTIFDHCEEYSWFLKKNQVSDTLKEITHNDGYNTNYFMYYSKIERPVFEKNE